MKCTFLSLSMLVAVASLMLGNTDAEARWRCCRGGNAYGNYGYQNQNAYYGNNYQQAGTYQATTGTGCGVAADPASAPATPPAPPQEVAPAPANQAPAAPAPGT